MAWAGLLRRPRRPPSAVLVPSRPPRVHPTPRISCEGRDLLPWFTMTTESRNRPTIVLRPASNRPSSASSACWVASRAFPTAVRASQTAGDSARQRPRDPNGTAPLPRQARRLSWLGGLDGQTRVRPPGHQAHELRRCSRRPIRKTPASEAYRADRGTPRMAATLPLPAGPAVRNGATYPFNRGSIRDPTTGLVRPASGGVLHTASTQHWG